MQEVKPITDASYRRQLFQFVQNMMRFLAQKYNVPQYANHRVLLIPVLTGEFWRRIREKAVPLTQFVHEEYSTPPLKWDEFVDGWSFAFPTNNFVEKLRLSQQVLGELDPKLIVEAAHNDAVAFLYMPLIEKRQMAINNYLHLIITHELINILEECAMVSIIRNQDPEKALDQPTVEAFRQFRATQPLGKEKYGL